MIPQKTLSPLELLLALVVVFIWGTNFVVIKWGLHEFPPLLFAAVRFTLATLPWIFLIARPKVPWRYLAAYGVFIGAGQFGLLFIAMRGDITPGLASLVIQVQVFFTVGLSLLWFRESLKLRTIAGLALAVAGLALIGMNVNASTTVLGLVLTLLAAVGWALGNMTIKFVHREHGSVNSVAFLVWSSPFAVPPLLLLSLWFEGGAGAAAEVLANATWKGWGAVLWQALGNTLFGYGIWNLLLTRHSAAVITPTALLIPVFGMGASALALGEPLQAWKLIAAALIVAGLGVNMLYRHPRERGDPVPRLKPPNAT